MHGQQTLKHLNEKAVAEAILAKNERVEIDPRFEQAVKEALVARAKNITE
jgi:hypothetical protein